MEPLILYTREGCHLCDQVVLMLDGAGIPWRPLDIESDPELRRRYGTSIPVLQHPDSRAELFFPFGETELNAFWSEQV